MNDENFKKIQTQLEAVEVEIDQLNDWERGFIESISDQFINNRYLTQPQQDTLEKIYHRLY